MRVVLSMKRDDAEQALVELLAQVRASFPEGHYSIEVPAVRFMTGESQNEPCEVVLDNDDMDRPEGDDQLEDGLAFVHIER